MRRVRCVVLLMCSVALLNGCAVDSVGVVKDRLHYNELVKVSAEQQLLLNIVRLRYSDTPSSLAVTSIASQSEVVRSFGVLPFFGVVGGESQLRGAARVLPQAQVSMADRPTMTLTPLDDSEFTRKLFTPMPLEGVIYLAKTTWPISTVFRLWLENLNWVPNAENASGPTPERAPEVDDFLAGVQALQRLQDRGRAMFFNEQRDEPLGSPMPAGQVRARDVVEAAKSGFEFKADAAGAHWTLVRKKVQPMLRIDPSELDSEDARTFTKAFGLAPGRASYDLVTERIDPFRGGRRQADLTEIDLETRSLLQVLYFVSKGVEVPAAHRQARYVPLTTDAAGREYLWPQVTRELISIRSSGDSAAPAQAHVSVRYLDHWYFVERSDHASMATFSLLLELARLETTGRQGISPTLTLPLGGR